MNPQTESAPQQAPVANSASPASMFTVEAPVSGLSYATLMNRVIATMVDGIVIFIVAFVLSLILIIPAALLFSFSSNTSSTSWGVGGIFFSLIMVVAFIVYESFFVSSKYQGTPGKILLKLKVTDVKGQRLTMQHALKRTVFKNIVSIIGILPIPFLSLFQFAYLIANMYFIYSDPNRQSLYDKYANTVVINA